MTTLDRDLSARRPTRASTEEQYEEAPGRAMHHYRIYNDRTRARPPSYLLDGNAPGARVPSNGPPTSTTRQLSQYQYTNENDITPPPPLRQPTDPKSPNYTFPPTKTPTGLTGGTGGTNLTGPLDLSLPAMSSQPSSIINSFFSAFFTAILSISTLGASLTFDFVLNGSLRTPPADSIFTTTHLQTFVALAWLFFVLALASAAAFQTLLKFYGEVLKTAWDRGGRGRKGAQWVGMAVSALLYGLVITAFTFLSLIVTAFTPAIGWTAVGFTGAFAIGGFGSILYQAPCWGSGKSKRRQ
jgi:hypothetical protein